MSGFATSEAATASSTMYESRVNMDLPVSKFTPVSTSVGRGGAPGVGDRAASGANRMRQPFASTWLPGGAGGHLPGGVGVAVGFTASTGSGQPTASTLVPAGVLGHWSMPSGTPSRSVSKGQPLASTVAPAGVLGHLSMPSGTPSLSESSGQPFESTAAPAGVSGQASLLSGTPSWSESLDGAPRWNTESPAVPRKCVAVVGPNVDWVLGL